MVVSGPSGVGKSSVIDSVIERTGSRFSVSVTTRQMRDGEIDGEDYHFVGEARFEELVTGGEFLEWAEYGGNRYGTLRTEVLACLDRGQHVILDIENDGAHQVKTTFPAAVLVFIVPPSLGELERRLRSRGDTSEADIARRLAVVEEQIRDAESFYDHLVVNSQLDNAISRVVLILQEPIPTGSGIDALPEGGGTETRSNSP
jgi:guanylate kinase